MFNVVRRVIQIENTTIAIGNKINDNQPIPDNPIMAINPTRADFAVDSNQTKAGCGGGNAGNDCLHLICNKWIRCTNLV